MRRDLTRLALAVLVTLCLGVLVPGHQGHSVAVDAAHIVHGIAVDDHAGGHDEEGGSAPAHDHSRCAICLFASTLTTPPVVDVDLSRHDRVVERRVTDATDLVAAEFIPTFYGRGPPVVA